MQIGSAREEITPDRKLDLLGQMHVRVGERTNDPLTVNAAAFADGARRVVLVSCDLCLLPDDFTREVQRQCQETHGLAANDVLIHSIHTHVAPCTVDYLFGQVDPQFMDSLRQALLRVVGSALADLETADLFAGAGWVKEMGFNRRGRRRDGTVQMYHGSWNADFAGVEGPRDGAVPVVFARRPDGSLKLVLVSFASHPNCIEGEKCYSADLAGATRAALRRQFGESVDVVYLTGAGGNTAPTQLEDNPERDMPWRGFDGLARSGQYLAKAVAGVIAETTVAMADPTLDLQQAKLAVPIRPWPSEFDVDSLREGPRDYYRRCRELWPELRQSESPVEVRVNVLRLGDAAVCTNPGEFYVEHGLAIRRGSPAAVTMTAELTDGYAGYIPTTAAFAAGGYSTQPALTSKLAEDAGDRIVAATAELLAAAFA